jgi:hypothetical protein
MMREAAAADLCVTSGVIAVLCWAADVSIGVLVIWAPLAMHLLV